MPGLTVISYFYCRFVNCDEQAAKSVRISDVFSYSLGMSVGLPSVLYLETYFLLSSGVKGFDW